MIDDRLIEPNELKKYGPPPPIYLPYLIYIPSNSLCWNLSIDTGLVTAHMFLVSSDQAGQIALDLCWSETGYGDELSTAVEHHEECY
jgi:hypothetical protein